MSDFIDKVNGAAPDPDAQTRHARHSAEDRRSDADEADRGEATHPTGDAQAEENAENESPS